MQLFLQNIDLCWDFRFQTNFLVHLTRIIFILISKKQLMGLFTRGSSLRALITATRLSIKKKKALLLKQLVLCYLLVAIALKIGRLSWWVLNRVCFDLQTFLSNIQSWLLKWFITISYQFKYTNQNHEINQKTFQVCYWIVLHNF